MVATTIIVIKSEMRNRMTARASACPVLNWTKALGEYLVHDGRGGAVRAAAGEDVDLGESLQAGQRRDDQDHGGGAAQQRPTDVAETPPWAGAIDAGRLHEVDGQALQGGEVEDDVLTEELPDAEGEDHDQGQRWRRREVGLMEPDRFEDAVYEPELRCEQVGPDEGRGHDRHDERGL